MIIKDKSINWFTSCGGEEVDFLIQEFIQK